MGKILKIAAIDIFHEFSEDKYIFLLITETILSTHKQSLLTRLARRGDVFVVYLTSDKSTSDVKNLVRYVRSMEVGDIIKSLPFLKGEEFFFTIIEIQHTSTKMKQYTVHIKSRFIMSLVLVHPADARSVSELIIVYI